MDSKKVVLPPHLDHGEVHFPVGPVEPEVMAAVSEFDGAENLEALQEWKALTPLQRRIVVEKLNNPAARNTEIGKLVGCGAQTVARLIHSRNFDRIADELARTAKKELVFEAVSVVRGLLKARSEQVRLKAAVAVLADAGILKDAEKSSTQKREISVTWKGNPPPDVKPLP